jgi:hypothetical protein
MDRDTAIEKIRKCLALSKSAEPHEAAAALRQAQKLMAQHGVDGQDLDMAQLRQHTRSVPLGALSAWQSALARLVSDAFGCAHLWQRGEKFFPSLGVRRTREIIFYGPDGAAELASYTWDVLLRQCVRARTAHVKAQPAACKPATLTARGDRFALGWVTGVYALVQRMAMSDEDPERRRQLLLAYQQHHWPQTTEVKPTRRDVGRNVRADDWTQGASAGAAADLRRGVGAKAGPARLGHE